MILPNGMRLVRRAEAERWLGVSPQTFKQLESDIPGFVRLSERISGWPEKCLHDYIESHKVKASA